MGPLDNNYIKVSGSSWGWACEYLKIWLIREVQVNRKIDQKASKE